VRAGRSLTLTATPTCGRLETLDDPFLMERDVIYATLAQGDPLVLEFVKDDTKAPCVASRRGSRDGQ
jgi:hypothetical protein